MIIKYSKQFLSDVAKLKGYCSINITGDIRAIYRIEEYEKEGSAIMFVRLGTHSELYS